MNQAIVEQLAQLPERLGWHMLLTVIALGVGIVVSIPTAILAVRMRPLQGPLLAAAGVIQTVPSLALLALMVVLLGGLIGFYPAIIALSLYSILPILRNTVTGIRGVDAAMTEAARGMGMRPGQILRKVELPLAAPVIIAGIRTSAVWVVGIATLSTPVGQLSLGNYIFEGLQLRNHAAVLVGCVAAALLAILLDLLIRGMEVAAVRRSKKIGIAAGVALIAVIGGGIAPLLRPKADTFVGAKTFTEQYILAELLSDRLRQVGFNVDKKQGMGSTILFDSLANNSVDCYVDYSGTIWATVMKRADNPGPDQVLADVTRYLKDSHGITCLGALGFENAYALAMRREDAERLEIRSIEDLAAHAPGLKIGGDYEFFGREEWKKLVEAYGLRFNDELKLDSTFMYGAVRDGEVDVISAFSTDGRIAAYDLVVLEDVRHSIPPYDAILLVSPKAAARPGMLDALRPLVGSISDDDMRNANKAVDLDKKPPAEAAQGL